MNAIGKFIKSLQIDTRLLGMIGALLVIWIVFDVVTGGLYLTPRNLFNLSVQTASVAVMATGMVFIIVTRHIDLSVGSLLGFLGMLMGTMQLHVLPEIVGTGHWSIWIITVIFGVVMGALIGAFQGWLVGYLTIPAFIVTLGGLLVWRGAAWWVTSGQTVAPLDQTFKLLGGGVSGTLGGPASWVLGIATHLAARHWRTESRRLRAFARHGGTHVGADATDAVADQVDAQDMLPALAEALARLRADERSIVLLWAAEDLSYAEIADALSIPIGTVRSRLSRARRRLAAATGAVDG